MKRIVAWALTAVSLFLLCACGSKSAVPTEAVDAVSAYVGDIQADSVVDVSYEVAPEDDKVNVTLWIAGMAEDMAIAQLGDDELWTYDLADIADFCNDVSDMLSESGFQDLGVSVTLMNDRDKDMMMAKIVNGVIYYDAVSGVDLTDK
jgi:hypothetical protein